MSNYTKSTNFATKDNLSPGDPLKIVRGTEIDTEFNNISTAISTKTDNSSAAITGGSITGITDLAIADGGTGASTATAAINNLLPSQTSNANKYLQTDGTNVSWDAVSLSTSDITGTLPVANGGTGITSFGTGIATFLGTPSSANLASAVTDETGSGALVFANTPTLVAPILGTPTSGNFSSGSFTWPTFNQNTTGTAAGLSATLAIASGGTGQTTANAAFNALAPSQTSASGKYLKSDGANTSWDALDISTADITGTLPVANGGTGVTSSTGTGSVVLSNLPTLVTPILGTPQSGNFSTGTFTWPTFNQNTTGTAAGLSATLATTSGGTGLTSFTSGGVVYASSSSALATGSALTFDGSNFVTTAASTAYAKVRSSGSGTVAASLFQNADTGTTDSDGFFVGTIGNTPYIYNYENSPMIFAVNAAEKMRIASAVGGVGAVGIGYTSLTSVGDNGLAVLGKVGIGTNSPTGKLTIAQGNIFATQIPNIDSSVTWNGVSTSFTAWKLNVTDTNSANGSKLIDLQASATTRFSVDKDGIGYVSGNLGVGTTSPALAGYNRELTVSAGTSGTARAGINIQGSRTTDSTFGALTFFHQANNVGSIEMIRGGADNSGAMQFFTANSGTIAERGRFSADGTFRVKGAGTAGSTDAVQFSGSAPASAMSLDSSGNLLVGTTNTTYSSGGIRLYANNSLEVVRDGSISSTYANIYLNKTGSTDGEILAFARSQTQVGSISVTSSTTAYNTTLSVNSGAQLNYQGIKFPATQSASSDANTLDDYEQGTFTPTVSGGTTAGTGTYTNQVGRYTKIGNTVTVSVYLNWSAHTGTGHLTFTNLPFTLVNVSNYYPSAAFGYVQNITLTALNVMTGFAFANSTTLGAYQYPAGGGASTTVPIDTSGEVTYTLTYEATA